jgi:hypothetical protein
MKTGEIFTSQPRDDTFRPPVVAAGQQMSPRWFLARRNLSRHFILKINSSALIVAKIKKQNKEFFL